VPASSIELVQKYIGGGKTGPRLAKIGGTLWTRQKLAVEKAVADMAADMLEIQAVRAKQPGEHFHLTLHGKRRLNTHFSSTLLQIKHQQ